MKIRCADLRYANVQMKQLAHFNLHIYTFAHPHIIPKTSPPSFFQARTFRRVIWRPVKSPYSWRLPAFLF